MQILTARDGGATRVIEFDLKRYLVTAEGPLPEILAGDTVVLPELARDVNDARSQWLRLPQDREAIVTDTVGFIRDLPPQLVAAFHATLEELREADLFLHVVDASSPALERRIRAVRRVLEEMGLGDVPELLVFNKIDRLPPGEGARLARSYAAAPISAEVGTGLVELVARAEAALAEPDHASTPALQGAAGRG